MKVVIDTDPGTDDALALMMALNSTDLDILGLTTVGGNISLASTTRNALRLLDYLGHPEIPVSPGASRPLGGRRFQYAPYFHGRSGLTVRLPQASVNPIPTRAHNYILSLASAFRGELVVLALGPMTNIARAIAKEPRVKGWVSEIVAMGGAFEVPGNVTPYAEFNTYSDAVAAEVVLSSGIPVTLVGLDVCNQVYLTPADIAWLSGPSKNERLAENIISNWFAIHNPGDRYNMCDPLAVVAAVRPDLLSYRQATVAVETKDQERMGRTTARYGSGSVRVATAVRADEAKELIRILLRGRR